MDTLISAIRTSAIIASTIIVIVALIVITWTVGVKLAEPFGVMLFNLCAGSGTALDDQESSNAHEKESIKISQHENRKRFERQLSGVITMFFAFFTVVIEHALAHGNGWAPPTLWNEHCVPVIKGILEAWFTLGMLRVALAAARRLTSN
jgi:hypothetical protein